MTSQLSCVKDYERRALQILPECVRGYYNEGEGEGFTAKWNKEAFNKYRILPRHLRNVSKREIATTVLGAKVSMPLGISPTGFQMMAHPDGECGNARAAEAANTVFILSSYSNTKIEDVAKAAPKAVKWMQVIIFRDRGLTLHMVKKAEEFDFKALVVIVDNPIYGRSKSSSLNNCLKSQMLEPAIFSEYLASNKDTSAKYSDDISAYMHSVLDDSLTWDDVAWLKSVTKLPIVLKGILTVEDALLGVKSGASAIFVSNHGGRQLDGEPATIEVLADIARAVGDEAEVYMDGGVTRGTDVFKALAFGARMVFMGKPFLWGLTCQGEEGSRSILEIMQQEIDHVFALTGCRSVKDITSDMVKHEAYFMR